MMAISLEKIIHLGESTLGAHKASRDKREPLKLVTLGNRYNAYRRIVLQHYPDLIQSLPSAINIVHDAGDRYVADANESEVAVRFENLLAILSDIASETKDYVPMAMVSGGQRYAQANYR